METKISCQIYDYKTKTGYDISNTISDLEITTHIKDDPGKATFTIVSPYQQVTFNEGAGVEIRLNGYGIFKGFVFIKEISQTKHSIKVTCYDQLRYLKNKGAKVFKDKTSDQIFSLLCDEYVLKYSIRDKSTHICTARTEDNVTLYEMIQNALDDTLINTGEWFIIIDNFGTLEHVNVYSLQPCLLIGDNSGLTEFTYKTSIDSNTYNQIALYREDDESNSRKLLIHNDSAKGDESTMLQWGVLQMYEKVDSDMTDAQMEQRAISLLDMYNHKTRTLTLTSIGNVNVRAGSLLQVNIQDIGNMRINNEVVLVTDCTHSIKDSLHTMSLTVEVMQQD